MTQLYSSHASVPSIIQNRKDSYNQNYNQLPTRIDQASSSWRYQTQGQGGGRSARETSPAREATNSRGTGTAREATTVNSDQFVVQWLASNPLPFGLRTPPSDVPAVASMLAPSYGSVYHGDVDSGPNAIPSRSSYNPFLRRQSEAQRSSSGHVSSSPLAVNAMVQREADVRRGSHEASQIAPYLQIPSTVNDSKGSLAQFAAQITCLFWFESSFTLHLVGESDHTLMPMTPLVQEAIPTMGFTKWVTTILSTTQVTQNVILLALLFIYRLKNLNPTVRGKPGSEYRLLTVALMLGNKFLDDNTYTNKTWAEVSGISVGEIHVMEVEFLSNMRYTLFASEAEWMAWQGTLNRFWRYFELASNPPPRGTVVANLHAIPLASPPPSHRASPPSQATAMVGPRLHPLSLPPYQPPFIAPPVSRLPESSQSYNPRKRSLEEESSELTSKRFASQPAAAAMASIPQATTSRPAPPNLLLTNNPPPSSYPPNYGVRLPLPTGRAMSTVYPQWPASGDLLHVASAQPAPSAPALPPLSISVRQNQPPSYLHHHHPPNPFGSRNPSPTASVFPTHDYLSPSDYSFQRSSPYRPIRAVNTLLVPPPGESFQIPTQQLHRDAMHYLPLGRPPSERKTGVVPRFASDTFQPLPLPGPHFGQPAAWPPVPAPLATFRG